MRLNITCLMFNATVPSQQSFEIFMTDKIVLDNEDINDSSERVSSSAQMRRAFMRRAMLDLQIETRGNQRARSDRTGKRQW
ncbi:hypothetical protein HGRIS_000268 [Hohenbuehelia grisea]|uniref:Uncharacterized protein n=2 Tax=Hohenbuehelia grisea TaxID=104357 RepID=A0ABR3JRQ3_9AGAR